MARKEGATPHSSRRTANRWRPHQAGDAGCGACSMQCPRGGRFPQAGRGVSPPSPDLSSGPRGARRRDWPRRKAFELGVLGVLLDAAPTGLLGFSSMVVPVLLRHGQTEIPPGGVLGQPGLSCLLPTPSWAVVGPEVRCEAGLSSRRRARLGPASLSQGGRGAGDHVALGSGVTRAGPQTWLLGILPHTVSRGRSSACLSPPPRPAGQCGSGSGV